MTTNSSPAPAAALSQAQARLTALQAIRALVETHDALMGTVERMDLDERHALLDVLIAGLRSGSITRAQAVAYLSALGVLEAWTDEHVLLESESLPFPWAPLDFAAFAAVDMTTALLGIDHDRP